MSLNLPQGVAITAPLQPGYESILTFDALTLAALSIQGFDDMQELNALKNLTSAVNYTVAALVFIFAGAISWPHTLLMLATATAGGYAGAQFARRLPARWLRRLVVGVGTSLTAIYFAKTYF